MSALAIRIKPGLVVAVSLQDGRTAFGRLLVEPLVEFFDFVSESESSPLPVDELRMKSILFRINVMNAAVTEKRWPIIGAIPLTAQEISRPERFFKQDPLSGRLTVSIQTGDSSSEREMPATPDDCYGLERDAVWSATHVEDRLVDHFNGVSNKWVESLKLKF